MPTTSVRRKLEYMELYIGNINDFSTEYLLEKCCKERIERSMKYRFEADRKRSLLVHALLNLAVSELYPEINTPIKPYEDEYGKPHILLTGASANFQKESKELYFSLSHSGEYAVCAIADDLIGTDIEIIKGANTKIVNRFLADEEKNYIKNADDFYTIWTLKESFMKAVGLGMRLPMDSFSVSRINVHGCTCMYTAIPSHKNTSSLLPFLNGSGDLLTITGWFSGHIPGYALAVAGRSLDGKINIHAPENL